MAIFPKKRYMEVDGQPVRMVTGKDNKGNNHILWHGPEEVHNGMTIGKNDLYITGLLGYSKIKDGCRCAISSNGNNAAINDGVTPPVIIYEPKRYYTDDKMTAVDGGKTVLSTIETTSGTVELYELDRKYWGRHPLYPNGSSFMDKNNVQWYNETTKQWVTLEGSNPEFFDYGNIGAGFHILGDKNPTITVTKDTTHEWSISKRTAASSLVTWNGTTWTINTSNGKLPDGDVIAMVKIGSNTDPYFKYRYRALNRTGAQYEYGNNGWHFHIGKWTDERDDNGFNFHTYQRLVTAKYHIGGDFKTLQTGSYIDDKYGDYYQLIVHTDRDTISEYPVDFIPVEEEWYELFLTPAADVVTGTKDATYKTNIIKVRKASAEHIKKWCGGYTKQDLNTKGKVIYKPDSINYKFYIKDKNNSIIDSISNTLTYFKNNNTPIKTSETIYSTPEIGVSSFYYKPSNKMILEAQLSEETPIIFNSENPINMVYYSDLKFLDLNALYTQNTISVKTEKENVAVRWNDTEDYYPGCTSAHTVLMSDELKYPLIVQYNPNAARLETTVGNFQCWVLRGNNYPLDATLGEHTKVKLNPTDTSATIDKYTVQCAQLQFASDYFGMYENDELGTYWDKTTTKSNMMSHWHFHYDGVFKIDITYSMVQQFVFVSPYTIYQQTTMFGSAVGSMVLLKYTDRDGKLAWTPIWSVNKESVYNMFYTYYSTAYSNIPEEMRCVKYVTLTLQDDNIVKNDYIKLMKDMAPWIRTDDYSNFYMSFEVANDIWDLDNYVNIYPNNVYVNTIIKRTDSKNKWNEYKVRNWYSETASIHSGIDNTKWFGGTDSYYEMIKKIFKPETVWTSNMSNGNGNCNGFLYCVEVQDKIENGISYVDNAESSCWSSIIVDNSVVHSERMDLTKYSCVKKNSIIVPDVNKYGSTITKIDNEVICYNNKMAIYSEIANKDVEIPGCFHKLLDSNAKIKNPNNATVITNRSSASIAYYGYVNKAEDKITYFQCSPSDAWAWTYTTTSHE